MTWRNALSLSAEFVIVLALIFGVVVFLYAAVETGVRWLLHRRVRRELSKLDRISLEATARLGRTDD